MSASTRQKTNTAAVRHTQRFRTVQLISVCDQKAAGRERRRDVKKLSEVMALVVRDGNVLYAAAVGSQRTCPLGVSDVLVYDGTVPGHDVRDIFLMICPHFKPNELLQFFTVYRFRSIASVSRRNADEKTGE